MNFETSDNTYQPEDVFIPPAEIAPDMSADDPGADLAAEMGSAVMDGYPDTSETAAEGTDDTSPLRPVFIIPDEAASLWEARTKPRTFLRAIVAPPSNPDEMPAAQTPAGEVIGVQAMSGSPDEAVVPIADIPLGDERSTDRLAVDYIGDLLDSARRAGHRRMAPAELLQEQPADDISTHRKPLAYTGPYAQPYNPETTDGIRPLTIQANADAVERPEGAQFPLHEFGLPHEVEE